MIDKILTKDKIQAEDVHQILKQYMLADGFEFVPDLKNSHGIYLVDEKTGDSYIDFFTFFASSPLGLNHPKLLNAKDELTAVAVNKPSNSDIFTTYMAEFDETYTAIKNNPDDIAVIIIEPIQGEGGDNFFRKEFFEKLREIADENEILLMFDEVQTGFGLTGKFWAAEHYVKPDIIAFGKKAQICGITVSDRIDDIDEHCFRKPSRINSTWGGNLVDMVRSKHILRTMEEENLVENSLVVGEHLLSQLKEIQKDFPNTVSNARGLGLMCSFDLPTTETRNRFKDTCLREKLIILGCGEKSIRFR